MNCVISCCRICELNSTRLASMEPSANTHAELTSHPPSENQTRCITTRVANIRISGLVTSDEPCDSSDEEVIEALNLCNPPNTCKKLSWSFCHSQSGSIGHAECLLYPYAVSYGSVVNTRWTRHARVVARSADWSVLPAQCAVQSVLLALSAAGRTRLVSDRSSAPR